MQKTAIISDIHARTEAFEAVLDKIIKQGVKRIICPGNLVGNGPDPLAVVDQSMEYIMPLNCDSFLGQNSSKLIWKHITGRKWT